MRVRKMVPAKERGHMVVDHEALEACVISVLLVRGFPYDEAKAYAEKIKQPRHDKALTDIVREVSSVMLCLESRGMLRSRVN